MKILISGKISSQGRYRIIHPSFIAGTLISLKLKMLRRSPSPFDAALVGWIASHAHIFTIAVLRNYLGIEKVYETKDLADT